MLIGNRAYPSPHDLPPVHKNVRDLSAALQQRGFRVTSAVDQDPAQLRARSSRSPARPAGSPPNATVLYYFTGHGMQVDAENLMLGAGVAPDSAADTLLRASLHLRRDVVDQLPRRPDGLTIAVVDACRTSLRAALAATDGLNQVEAPLGCLIVFSTGAGKPAIAPAVETLNTFYTGSLVKLLGWRRRDLVFRHVPPRQARRHRDDAGPSGASDPPVHPDPLHCREHAGQVQPVARPANQPAAPKFGAEDEAAAWKELDASLWPADIVKLAEAFLQKFSSQPPARRRSGRAGGRRRRN